MHSIKPKIPSICGLNSNDTLQCTQKLKRITYPHTRKHYYINEPAPYHTQPSLKLMRISQKKKDNLAWLPATRSIKMSSPKRNHRRFLTIKNAVGYLTKRFRDGNYTYI